MRPKYDDYLAWFNKWMIPDAAPFSFDEWWRAAAAEEKDRAKYQD